MDQFARLPGIGKKTAQRLSFARPSRGRGRKFADAIVEAHKKSTPAKYAKISPTGKSARCALGHEGPRDHLRRRGPERRHGIRADGDYNGLYHVLHGVISMDGGVPTEYA